jgi:hypothetical protein
MNVLLAIRLKGARKVSMQPVEKPFALRDAHGSRLYSRFVN